MLERLCEAGTDARLVLAKDKFGSFFGGQNRARLARAPDKEAVADRLLDEIGFTIALFGDEAEGGRRRLANDVVFRVERNADKCQPGLERVDGEAIGWGRARDEVINLAGAHDRDDLLRLRQYRSLRQVHRSRLLSVLECACIFCRERPTIEDICGADEPRRREFPIESPVDRLALRESDDEAHIRRSRLCDRRHGVEMALGKDVAIDGELR